MKAHEVLKRYANGIRDFSGENLRGLSFNGKNLSGANFSKAYIQGANFNGAILEGTTFSGARAGLTGSWLFLLLIASLLVASLSGFTSAIVITFTVYFFTSKKLPRPIALLFSVTFIALIRMGLSNYFGSHLVAWNIYLSVAVILAVALFGATAATVDEPESRLGSTALVTFVCMALLIVVVVNIIGEAQPIGGVVGGVVAGGFGGAFGSHFGRKAIDGDIKFSWIWKISVHFAAISGTSFKNADLTDANFTQATLKSTDLREANLTRTWWHQAKMLDFVHPGTTYLQTAQVRQLLITGQGQAQNFDRQNLRGVNLQGANLADASFIGADLSEANLQDADLSRAKLVQTQLDETDLTGATLTGAYIEDWGITSHTKLHGVKCEYVFMRLPTKEDPNPRRKPDNWKETFKDGDFADFIKPIVDTLDLYHNQDVDPRAIAISFKQLAENHPEAELEILAMEKRGGDKFMLRVATAPDANHSELNAEYFDTYNEIKALAQRELQALLAEKDCRISSLETMIATALQRPSFYAQTYHNLGDTMPEAPKSEYTFHGSVGSVANQGSIGSSGNPNAIGNAAADVKGDPKSIQHNYNYAPEQRQTLAEAAAEIQQLLKQLEQTNPTATEIEQKAFLTAAIPPTKRQKFVNALQEGGKELFKELMDNIYVNVAIAAIEGWQSVE
jgi:uncharacterized protein YjbI with pentapeptide repeats